MLGASIVEHIIIVVILILTRSSLVLVIELRLIEVLMVLEFVSKAIIQVFLVELRRPDHTLSELISLVNTAHCK